MLIESAVEIINNGLTYKPGWNVTAKATNRHESVIRVEVIYPARQSERTDYPTYPNLAMVGGEPGARAGFFIFTDDLATVDDLVWRLIQEVFMPIEVHEWREFLRVHPTGWAPFHPHRIDGMKAWSQRSGQPFEVDFKFGLTRY